MSREDGRFDKSDVRDGSCSVNEEVDIFKSFLVRRSVTDRDCTRSVAARRRGEGGRGVCLEGVVVLLWRGVESKDKGGGTCWRDVDECSTSSESSSAIERPEVLGCPRLGRWKSQHTTPS